MLLIFFYGKFSKRIAGEYIYDDFYWQENKLILICINDFWPNFLKQLAILSSKTIENKMKRVESREYPCVHQPVLSNLNVLQYVLQVVWGFFNFFLFFFGCPVWLGLWDRSNPGYHIALSCHVSLVSSD